MIARGTKKGTLKDYVRRVLYFFPFQLVLINIKRSFFLLLIWAMLFAYVSGMLAKSFGIYNLFLYPTYFGKVNFVSFGILGFAIGSFITAFNIYSYILSAFKFPFLATVNRSFLTFSVNNFTIPFIFIVYYLMESFHYQKDNYMLTDLKIIQHLIGFVGGVLLFYLISYGYFYFFDRNANSKRILKRINSIKGNQIISPYSNFIQDIEWYKHHRKGRFWHIETYIKLPLKIKLARSSKHYRLSLIRDIFYQNQVNATIFEIVAILSFLIIGLFREYEFFLIPSAASIVLLLTIILMISSALYSWFGRWTNIVFLVLILGINFLTIKYDIFKFKNYAYGVNYNTEKVKYSENTLETLFKDSASQKKDYQSSLKVLNNWKRKNQRGREKPKLLLVSCNGGGSRSAVWTYYTLSCLDTATHGKFGSATHLITGASGGMIGASYFREIYRRKLLNDQIDLLDYKYDLSNDMLSPLAFSIATSDFIRISKIKYGNHTYTKDRGYIFEKRLNEFTNNVLDKKLIDYKSEVEEAEIPLMIFAPTIVNDGRRLLISSQGLSYFNWINIQDSNYYFSDNVPFRRLFKEQDADSISFTSVIRMSASFPFILPTVTLPSEPILEVNDAGIRDNNGIKTISNYLYLHKDWIEENTSGIILLQIRDAQYQQHTINEKDAFGSLFRSITSPLNVLTGKFLKVQEYNNIDDINNIKAWFGDDFHNVILYIDRNQENNISLSFYLTEKEKEQIFNSINNRDNQNSIERLKGLLE